MVEKYEVESGSFERERGPLGTSAWALFRNPQGEVIAYAVGDDEEDALKEAAHYAGYLVVSKGKDKT